YQAIALTDINVMYGAVKFYQVAKENNIKPLFGVTLQVNGLINTATVFPIVLIAENQTGYQNLMWISSAKMTTKVSEMTLDVITGHLAGINVIFPNDSEISQFIASEYTQSVDYWQQLSTKIDPKKLYLGINPQLAPQIQERLVTFSEKNQAKLIALDTVDYLNSDDAFTTQVLKAIETNTKLDDIKLLAQQVGTHVLQDFNEVQIAYLANDALKTAYLNNELLVSKSHVEIIFKQTATLPKFHLPNENQTSENYLRYIAEKGLLERINGRQVALDQYEKRLQHELQIINNLAFNDYFLIVWDYVRWAKVHKIQVGPGRGSAAGSLVAYVLGITNIDPLRYDLLFERFLNPERVSMPDIDIDFQDDRRDEVIRYVIDKYG
ncbi:MAG: PHP domain-containing protein, partial [Leuconostoc gelidum]